MNLDTDFWIFVLNPLDKDGCPSMRGGPPFFKIMEAIREIIIETTPNTSFEAFPSALNGYNTMLIRIRPETPKAWSIPEDWETDRFPWCVFSGQGRPSKLTLVQKFNFQEGNWQAFLSWLDKNKRWLWKPLY